MLETKSIATFALLFGTTWIVNAMVFALVAGALALAYVIKPEWLLELSFAPRPVVAVLLAFLPIYLAAFLLKPRDAVTV